MGIDSELILGALRASNDDGLHPPSGQFFPQGGCILLYRISRHELMREPALGFDLSPDIIS